MTFPTQRIAIIGTAGRDKTRLMNLALWDWMVAKALSIIPEGSHLVSGGAAWADHVACELYRQGHAASLHLYLPAPFERGRYQGPNGSATAANYYHENFTQAINRFTLNDIKLCLAHGATYECEPAAPGFRGFFDRNKKVAQAEGMLAFTFGEHEPADGGTRDTWLRHEHIHGNTGQRHHVSLTGFIPTQDLNTAQGTPRD